MIENKQIKNYKCMKISKIKTSGKKKPLVYFKIYYPLMEFYTHPISLYFPPPLLHKSLKVN